MHVVDLSHVLLASHFPRGGDLYGGRESFWLCYVRTPPKRLQGLSSGRRTVLRHTGCLFSVHMCTTLCCQKSFIMKLYKQLFEKCHVCSASF